MSGSSNKALSLLALLLCACSEDPPGGVNGNNNGVDEPLALSSVDPGHGLPGTAIMLDVSGVNVELVTDFRNNKVQVIPPAVEIAMAATVLAAEAIDADESVMRFAIAAPDLDPGSYPVRVSSEGETVELPRAFSVPKLVLREVGASSNGASTVELGFFLLDDNGMVPSTSSPVRPNLAAKVQLEPADLLRAADCTTPIPNGVVDFAADQPSVSLCLPQNCNRPGQVTASLGRDRALMPVSSQASVTLTITGLPVIGNAALARGGDCLRNLRVCADRNCTAQPGSAVAVALDDGNNNPLPLLDCQSNLVGPLSVGQSFELGVPVAGRYRLTVKAADAKACVAGDNVNLIAGVDLVVPEAVGQGIYFPLLRPTPGCTFAAFTGAGLQESSTPDQLQTDVGWLRFCGSEARLICLPAPASPPSVLPAVSAPIAVGRCENQMLPPAAAPLEPVLTPGEQDVHFSVGLSFAEAGGYEHGLDPFGNGRFELGTRDRSHMVRCPNAPTEACLKYHYQTGAPQNEAAVIHPVLMARHLSDGCTSYRELTLVHAVPSVVVEVTDVSSATGTVAPPYNFSEAVSGVQGTRRHVVFLRNTGNGSNYAAHSVGVSVPVLIVAEPGVRLNVQTLAFLPGSGGSLIAGLQLETGLISVLSQNVEIRESELGHDYSDAVRVMIALGPGANGFRIGPYNTMEKAQGDGGTVFIDSQAEGLVYKNVLRGGGTGLRVSGSAPIVTGNIFASNSVGIDLRSNAAVEMRHNMFAGNESSVLSAGLAEHALINSVAIGPQGPLIGPSNTGQAFGGQKVDVSFSHIDPRLVCGDPTCHQGNGYAPFAVDDLVDPVGGDVRVKSGSGLIDQGEAPDCNSDPSRCCSGPGCSNNVNDDHPALHSGAAPDIGPLESTFSAGTCG